MKFHFPLPSISSLYCVKPPAVKETENVKKEEGQGTSSASASTSASPYHKQMPGNRPPAWLNKEFEKKPDYHFQWEEGSLLLTPERGDALLRNMKLEKAKYGSGREGEISTFENESGERIAGKFPYPRGKNKVDEIARELEVYNTIYQKAGHHPNLLNVYGIAKVSGTNGDLKRGLLMEKIQGPTGWDTFAALRHCRDTGKISSGEYEGAIKFLGRRLLDVTDHIGKAGVVHGDIKPQNFLVNKDTGEPVLIDFGSAGFGEEFVRGVTLPYAPPEYRKGDIENIGVKSDMFSVGATLFHGIEPDMKQMPMWGPMDQSVPIEDEEGNLVMHEPGAPGTYSEKTPYIDFLQKVLEKDVSSRVTIAEAKEHEFLNDSMLDDDAAKAIIKKAIQEA